MKLIVSCQSWLSMFDNFLTDFILNPKQLISCDPHKNMISLMFLVLMNSQKYKKPRGSLLPATAITDLSTQSQLCRAIEVRVEHTRADKTHSDKIILYVTPVKEKEIRRKYMFPRICL